MRAVKRVRPATGTWFVLPFVVLLSVAPARADRRPLPPGEQAEVNHAIDQGVHFLKQTQLPTGTWAADGKHAAGLAALPGLTLLECGVSPDDPAVKRAAAFVRASVPKMDETYELALGVLFLDRLGDPRDEKLIQGMALRLVAGQSVTGGWGYKCPPLSAAQNKEILLLLRQINPKAPPVGGPGLAGFPAGGGPDLVGKPAVNPGPALVGGPAVPSGPGLVGGPTLPSPGETLTPVGKSPGETPAASPGATIDLPAGDGNRIANEGRLDPPGWLRSGWCIKMEEEPPPSAPVKPAAPRQHDDSPTIPASVIVPADLRGLAVVQDFSQIALQDPPERLNEVVAPTTDNSNSQFAILALWVAQRHEVPLDRTLRLIANRFQTGQNADGSWDYRYTFGGGNKEGAAMDCVGLLGLAVGHGLANNGQPAAQPVNDPKILGGFAALTKHVGAPAGRTRDLPVVSLYLLWSIERVAVLYDLPTIADKDWYRWGAEVLVANQSLQGDWPDGGGYPGAAPPINTSLALLFLRRANLVSDLTGLLPFKPDDLTKSITDTVAPPKATEPAAAVFPTIDTAKAPPPPAPPTPPSPLGGYTDQNPAPAPAASAPPPAARGEADLRNQAPVGDGGGRGWLVIVLVVLALLLLAAATVVLVLHFRNRDKAKKAPKEGNRKKAAGKRPTRLAADAPAAKKSTGKTGLHA